jgi:RNA polymerase sigma-70 factor (ECF subfamily)
MDQNEFTHKFRPLLPKISTYLIRRVPVGEVEDLASLVVEIAWIKRAQCPENFELAWLYRICGFIVSNYRRKQMKRGIVFELLSRDNPAPSAEDVVISNLHMKKAFDALNPRDRQILSYFAFEGLTVTEIAVALGTSANTATQRLKRARARLAAELDKE